MVFVLSVAAFVSMNFSKMGFCVGIMSSVCPFLLLLSFAFGTASPVHDCEADHDCMPGYFCFTVTKYCSPCIDCATYNRNKKIFVSCAINPTESCGSCLSGFEEDILAGGQVRDWCVPAASHSGALKSDNAQSYFHVGWPIGICLVVMMFFFAVFWKSWRTAPVINRIPDAPPPYVSACNADSRSAVVDSPLTNDSGVVSSSCACSLAAETSYAREHHQSWQQTKEEGALQQAVPFRYPLEQEACLALLDDSDDDDSGSSDNESIVHEPPDLEDDTTMPSDWTPHPCPEGCSSVQEENECHNDASNDVVDGESEDVTEPPCKKKKEDSDDEAAEMPASVSDQ